MNKKIIKYIYYQKPTIDIHGKWLTIGNPKTAQKSMMGKILDYRQIMHRRGYRNWERVWDQIIVPNIDNVFIFTFVRNPWDKVVSAFHFLKKKGVIPKEIMFRNYVKDILAISGTDIDVHFREQSSSFLYNKHEIPGIFIGRFEQLYKDWKYVANKINETTELPHINASKHIHYTKYYDNECIEIVRNLYKKEIDYLGYKYGP